MPVVVLLTYKCSAALLRLMDELLEELGARHRADLLLPAAAHGHGALLLLAVADGEDVRDLLELGVADLAIDRGVAEVGVSADAGCAELCEQGLRRGDVAVREREHPGLDRREPDRERSLVVLHQDADEAEIGRASCRERG